MKIFFSKEKTLNMSFLWSKISLKGYNYWLQGDFNGFLNIWIQQQIARLENTIWIIYSITFLDGFVLLESEKV